jgi:hypothetical protein
MLTPITLPIQETEIRESRFKASPKSSGDPILKIPNTKQGWFECMPSKREAQNSKKKKKSENYIKYKYSGSQKDTVSWYCQ